MGIKLLDKHNPEKKLKVAKKLSEESESQEKRLKTAA